MMLDRLRRLLGGWSRSKRLRIRRRSLRFDFLSRVPFQMEQLEDRRVLATVNWDGGLSGTGTDWGTAANWVGDVLPGSTDDAVIGAGFSVTHSNGTHTVASITDSGNFMQSGGTLVVNGAM